MSDLESLTRQNRFTDILRLRYANDGLALKIILGKREDGSYDRARAAFAAARGMAVSSKRLGKSIATFRTVIDGCCGRV